MKYCSTCGNAIEAGEKFCKHCGASLEQTEVKDQQEDKVHTEVQLNQDVPDGTAQTAAASEQKETTQKSEASAITSVKQFFSNMNPRRKKWLGIGVGSLLVLIIAYNVIGSLNSPKRVAEKFETALEENDKEALETLLVTKDDKLEINDDALEGMLNYLNENADEKDQVLTNLNRQADDYEKYGDKFSELSHEPFSLTKGKQAGLFTKYEIVVRPVYFEVHTNFKDTKIYANGEKVATANADEYKKKVGPFFPGAYAFKAVYKTEALELKKEEEAGSMMPSVAAGVYLDIRASTANFELPFRDGVSRLDVYLNGKKTKFNLLESKEVKPVLTDGTIKASYEAQFPWGKMRSEERPIDSSYADIPFIVNKQLQDTLKKDIIQAEKETIEALTSYGAKKPKTMSPGLAKAVVETGKEMKSMEKGLYVKYLGTDFDSDGFQLERSANRWQIKTSVKHYYEKVEFFKFTKSRAMKQDDESIAYTFAYDDKAKKWVLAETDYGYIRDENNVSEYREKDQKLYKTK